MGLWQEYSTGSGARDGCYSPVRVACWDARMLKRIQVPYKKRTSTARCQALSILQSTSAPSRDSSKATFSIVSPASFSSPPTQHAPESVASSASTLLPSTRICDTTNPTFDPILFSGLSTFLFHRPSPLALSSLSSINVAGPESPFRLPINVDRRLHESLVVILSPLPLNTS